MAEDIDLRVVAQRTPGFVGADLENIANEATIGTVLEDHDCVTMEDFEAAIDRIVAGPEKKHRVLNSEEKKRVAFHESGHALVAVTVPTGEPVHKVSIIPRGVAAIGYTMQLPVDEKFLSTKKEFKDQIAILLGVQGKEERNYSEETAKLIDGEIRALIEEGLERATRIIAKKRSNLDTLAELLQEKEVISGEEVVRVMEKASNSSA